MPRRMMPGGGMSAGATPSQVGSAPTHAGGMFAGRPTNVQSNVNASGAITGYQIGSQIPGVLESLQEGPRATYTPSLYYDETLGQINQPSFQRGVGTLDRIVENVQQFGDTGTFTIPNDIFWNGPAAIRMTVGLNPRFMGLLHNVEAAVPPHYKPSIFYSWGAGYASILRWRTNLGGAGQYVLDRYANWVGIMASCESTFQRACLMKLAGGGVIAETPGFEGPWGLSGSTANYVNDFPVPLPWNGGRPYKYDCSGIDGNLNPTNARIPVSDNWIVCLRTPHTNFNNPRVRRRPLDTKLFSEYFTVDLTTAPLQEFSDTSTGNPVFSADVMGTNPGNPSVDQVVHTMQTYQGLIMGHALPPIVGIFTTGFQRDPWISNNRLFPEYFRQYERGVCGLASTPLPIDFTQEVGVAQRTVCGVSLSNFNSRAPLFSRVKSQIENQMNPPNAVVYAVPPIADDYTLMLTPPTPEPGPYRNASDYRLEIKTMISSLRLTNDMLGAYSAIATRTDLAVYYPFQHLTTQIYSTPNVAFGGQSLASMIANPSAYTTFNGEIDLAKACRLPINIPVNPMTAMYICIFREKDRQNRAVGTPGAYTPALFWNALRLEYLEVAYGSQPLVRYPTHAEYMTEQAYEHSSSIQVPYKGGFCSISEFDEEALKRGLGSQYGKTPKDGAFYHGVIRDAFIYEISLVEMEPMRNEAFFQNTPSFQGEQLNITFQIPPFTESLERQYDPSTDKTYLDDYTAANFNGFRCEPLNLWLNSGATDANSGAPDITFNNPVASIRTDEIGVRGTEGSASQTAIKANGWALNNDSNLMVAVIFAQNALWQLNPNASKLVFARG